MEEAIRWYGSDGTQKAAAIEDENRKLKSLVADLTLDKHMLQEVIAKKL